MKKPRVEGRHAHQHRGARHELDDLVGIELVQKDHRCTREQRHIAGHEQAMRVIDRQCVNQDVLLGKAPDIDQRQ